MWHAYFALEPPDEMRDDWRAAQIAAMIFNMGVAQKDRKPIKHFLLEFDEPTEGQREAPKSRQSVEEQLLMLKMWAITSQNNVRTE